MGVDSVTCREESFKNKWVFRIKTEPDGKRRFKARLVVKGY